MHFFILPSKDFFLPLFSNFSLWIEGEEIFSKNSFPLKFQVTSYALCQWHQLPNFFLFIFLSLSLSLSFTLSLFSLFISLFLFISLSLSLSLKLKLKNPTARAAESIKALLPDERARDGP